MVKKHRTLYFDIETTPNLALVWSVGKQHVSYESIFKEKKVSCICYNWEGSNKVHKLKMNLSKHDLLAYDDDADKEMLKEFIEIYKTADVAVGHNAIKFDIGTISARLIKHGLPPIEPIILDDSYLQSTGIRFNCHKLDYLSRYLGLGQKASHPYQDWVDIMHGWSEALDRQVKYCARDVIMAKDVWNRLKPYVKSKFNQSVYYENPELCPSCGSKLVKDGTRKTLRLGIKQQYECTGCGKKILTGKNLLKGTADYPREG
jgi:hypothetical protein